MYLTKERMRKRLFFDIETSFNIGFFWRSGYNQTITPEQILHERAIICVCWKWEGKDEIHSLTWDKKQSDKGLLSAFIKELNKADEIVAHNGDRFDVKWLRTRCLKHGLDMFPSYQSIDTLKTAKKLFNFNSNKLDYIAKYLGVGEKMDTGGLDLWKKIVFDKDKEALDHMVKYCLQDVAILEKVFNVMNKYEKPKVNYAALKYEEKYCCPECASSNIQLRKTYTTAIGTIRHNMKCKECNKPYTINQKIYSQYIKDRLRNKL
jgi:uncharacterized protein YprB with RNaseH-like and TPR domain